MSVLGEGVLKDLRDFMRSFRDFLSKSDILLERLDGFYFIITLSKNILSPYYYSPVSLWIHS
jgi:hypothetical protein